MADFYGSRSLSNLKVTTLSQSLVSDFHQVEEWIIDTLPILIDDSLGPSIQSPLLEVKNHIVDGAISIAELFKDVGKVPCQKSVRPGNRSIG